MQKKQSGRSSLIILLLLRVGYLDVEVVGSQDQLKKGSLVYLRKKVSVRARLRRCQESPKFEEEKTASPEKMSPPKSFSKSYSYLGKR